MPRITIRAGFPAPDGEGQEQEEILTEYLCDSPGCPNVAVYSLGCLAELRVMAAVCEEHIPKHLRDGRTAP